MPPPVAVTVRVEAAIAVVELADNVSVLWPLPGAATLDGDRLGVTPLGAPVIDSATAELNPVPAAVVMVIGVDPLRATLAVVALSDSVKVPETVRLNVWVLVTPPPEAVMVRADVPGAFVELAVSVSLLLPLPGEAMLVGEKPAVTPAGSPLIDNATAELNPFTRAVVRVIGTEAPGATLALVALGARVKLEGATMVRPNVTILSVPPPTAASVRV